MQQRKRKPLSQLTLDEIEHGKRPKNNGQNSEFHNSYESIQPKAGTVSRMVLKNFMCHSHLEVIFDHNINYVIGRNGSGKSAILAALVVGLGGKASLTNRGNSIKGFIKAGQHFASVEVTLRNAGPMAYRYTTYGNTITIVRNFSSNGTSSYKIKNSSGDVVTTQCKEAQRICTSLNIQIDNPICLLNQDTSRNFLNSKDPLQKFLLFMRATQLQDLFEEYQKLFKNKVQALQMLNEKEQLYDKLRNELENLQKKVENHRSINNLKDHSNYLQRELYWEKLRIYESDVANQEEVVQQIQEEVDVIKDQIENESNRSATIQQKIIELEQKVNDLQESIEFQNEPQNAQVRTLGNLKDSVNSKRRDRRVVLKDIAVKSGNCAILQQEIDSMKENVAGLERKKMERMQTLAQVEETLKGIEGLLETSKNDQFQINNALERLHEEEYNVQSELQQIRVQIENNTSRLNSLKGRSGNSLSLYGQDMPRIIDAINAVKHKFVHLPRGPLGSYITLKDKKWAVAVEGFFGPAILRAFAVDNKQDNELLMNIFKHHWGMGSKPMVITSKFFNKIHDVSQNIVLPTESCISVFSALEISDPVVANCLIDQTHLEGVLLIPDTETAICLMNDKRHVPRNCKQSITIKGDRYYPDPNYKTYGSRYHTAQYLQVSTADIIQHLDQKLQELRVSQNMTMKRNQTLKTEVQEHTTKMHDLEVKVTKLHRAQLHTKRNYDDLKNSIEPDVANVTALEVELTELKRVIEQQKELEQRLCKDTEVVTKQIEESEKDLDRIKNICRGYEDRIEPLQEQIRNEVALSKEYKTNKHFANRRLQECRGRLADANEALQNKIASGQSLSEYSRSMGDRIANGRDVKTIIIEIKATDTTIKQIESEVDSPEDLLRKYERTNATYKKASEIMQDMSKNVTELQTATEKCCRYYKHTENYFISYVKHAFQRVLELRQFEGNIEIDMKTKKLDLIVIPQQGSQGYTTTANLSGGERSFSTVAFLYSLWQCMEFPFYFLDEFDVFMDKLNRTKVMEVLLHHAKSRPDLQFVFLTPQDVSFVNDKDVTIHRLEDPERSITSTH